MFSISSIFKPAAPVTPTECTQAAHDFAGPATISKADLQALGGWSDIHGFDIDAAAANEDVLTLTFPSTTAQTEILPGGSRKFCGKIQDDGKVYLPATEFSLDIPADTKAIITFTPLI